MNRREKLRVNISQPKTRLDKFLQKEFSDTSRATFQRFIQEGDVLVNGQKVKPTHQPRLGEEIVIVWPHPDPAEAIAENIPLDILFEDERLLVINKSAGLVVHPAPGVHDPTLVDQLGDQLGGGEDAERAAQLDRFTWPDARLLEHTDRGCPNA